MGAGLAGASVAWHLAPHAEVRVIDQASQSGAEASAQNAGMIRRLGEDPYERALAVRTASWMADPGPDFEETSRVTGSVIGLAVDDHWLSDGVAHLRARGVRVEAVDRVHEIAPALVGAPLRKAWHLPDDRVADAHGLVQGFLRGAKRHGTVVSTGVCATRLVTESGRVVGVETSAGSFAADAVVVAAGAWSAALAATAGRRVPLIPIRRTLLQTAPHPLSSPTHPWCWIDDVGIYARPEGTGWLVSGCDEAVDPPVGPDSRGAVDPELRALAATKLDRFLPSLAHARFTGGWTGLRTFAPDRRPILGADPDLEGLWWAAGLGGFGVTTCYAVGECVAGWMLGRDLNWITARGVSAGRPFLRRWPIRPDGTLSGSELVDVLDPGGEA